MCSILACEPLILSRTPPLTNESFLCETGQNKVIHTVYYRFLIEYMSKRTSELFYFMFFFYMCSKHLVLAASRSSEILCAADSLIVAFFTCNWMDASRIPNKKGVVFRRAVCRGFSVASGPRCLTPPFLCHRWRCTLFSPISVATSAACYCVDVCPQLRCRLCV